ncbi:hypothetical protein [Wolbachia endosymbiont of Armadillidium arcangelii]|uniref:Uncharacterized protein n=1 Tax=Wolbachia endosymbiont of Armadillidium arcangelii TaxID=3158571 RepID=A0AAU7Q3A2_9RICK
MFLTGKLYVLPLLTVNDMTLGFLKSRCYQVLADAGLTLRRKSREEVKPFLR